MGDFLNVLLEWVNNHPAFAGIIVGLISLLESLAIIGVVVPGVVILFGVGALIGAGVLDFWTICLWAILGAIIGDGLSFLLGRHYHVQISRYISTETLDKGHRFFQQYGGKSVLFGRFFGPIRAIIPLIAGMMEMPPARFYLANVASALIWAPAYLLPGVVFGASVDQASDAIIRLLAVVFLLTLFAWLLFQVGKKVSYWLEPHTNRLSAQLLKVNIVNSPEQSAFAKLFFISLPSFLLIVLFALPTDIETTKNLFFLSISSPDMDFFMRAISSAGDSATLLVSCIAGWMLLKVYNQAVISRYWLLSILGIWLITLAAEFLLMQNRQLINHLPNIQIVRLVTLTGVIALVINASLDKSWRLVSWLSLLLLSTLIVISENYYQSPAAINLAAVMFALSVISLIGLFLFDRNKGAWLKPAHALTFNLTIICLLLLSAVSTERVSSTPIITSIKTMNGASWWRQAEAAANTVELLGQPKHLFEVLQKQGWQKQSNIRFIDWLKFFSPKTPLSQLPILPQGNYDSKTLVSYAKNINEKRYVLLLWRSQFIDEVSNQYLWHGKITLETKTTVANLFNTIRQTSASPTAIKLLEDNLSGNHFISQSINQHSLLIKKNQTTR